jgi:hypothetical protein
MSRTMSDESEPKTAQKTLATTQGTSASLGIVVQKKIVAEPVTTTARLTRAWNERVPKWLRISSGRLVVFAIVAPRRR